MAQKATAKQSKGAAGADKKLSKAEMLRRKENRSAWIKTICAVLVIAIVIGGFVLNDSAVKNGVYKRAKITATSNDKKVTGTMMSYFFYNEYLTFCNNYYSYLSYLGLSTSTSLKMQVQDKETGATWYDYFLNMTKNEVSYTLAMAQKAEAAGMTLDEDDYATIEESIAAINEYASENSTTPDAYVASLYGTGVKVSDMRACMELSALADKYYYAQVDLLEYTDSQISDYYAEHENDYRTADYRYYKLSYGEDKDITTAAQASKLAAELAACTTDEAFDKWITDYMSSLVDSDGNAAYTADEIATAVSGSYQVGAGYTEDSDISKWAFDAATQVGTTKVINDDTSYTALLLNTAARRDESATVNARHILLEKGEDESDDDYKARAEALLAEWKAGDATEASFAALATENSIDTGSAKKGGLYENIIKGKMTDEFDAWIYDSARQPGDCEVVFTEDYGYHIIYFCGNGAATWMAQVEDDMIDEDSTQLIKDVEEEIPTVYYDSRISSLVP